MPGAESIDVMKAAQADVLAGSGYNPSAIARATGLARSSVYDVLKRVGHWGEIAETPVFAKLRREQSVALESAGRALAAKAMVQCEDMLPKANAYQACLISSIMIDKSRLLAGEATQIVDVNTKLEVAGLDKFCAALSQALLADQAVDITPQTNTVTEAQTVESAK